jgi:cold shock CspA family protein
MGAITITLFEKYLNWRFAFMLQGWFMILIGLGFIITDNKNLDIFSSSSQIKSASQVTRPKSISEGTVRSKNIGQVQVVVADLQ